MTRRVEPSEDPLGAPDARVSPDQQFRLLVDAIDDGVVLFSADATILGTDDTLLELTGHDRTSLVGEHASALFDLEGTGIGRNERGERSTDGSFETLLERRAAAHDPFQVSLETATGSRRVAELHLGPFTAEGETIGVVRDVSERVARERRLEESKRRYRTLVEHFPNGIVTLFDRNGTYTLAAGKGFDVLPEEPADLEGSNFREVWDDESVEELEPAIESALAGRERVVEFEDAGREWRVHAVPLLDDGAVSSGLTMAQDITEQKVQERYLRDAKAQLEAAAEAGAIGTWEWQVEEDRFVTGAAFAKTFGVDPEAAREGVSLDTFVSSIHEADRERVEREIESALERCSEYESEYRVRNDDGDLRWVVARGHVECDEDGDPVAFPGALADITDRKRAERRLERHKKQLETLFEVLPVGVVVSDGDGRLVEANETAREIWGGNVFDANDVGEYERYRGWWADTGEPVAPDEWTMARVVDGEEVTDPDVFEIEAADGERRTVMIHGMPVKNDRGEVIRGVITQTDITARRTYQHRLEESNERLEQFAYGASHDLQEPLRMVSSYLQLLEQRYGEQLDDDGREFLEFAVDGADRMRGMIDGLLAYSRVETGGQPLEPVDLESVFADVREDLMVQLEEEDATVVVGDLPQVRGDPDQLRQVFQNLLSNAVTYSDGAPEVRVTADRRGSEWHVAVEDDGIGIDPEDADRVFEVFERLHGREEYAGTGIGLALCERIVERHGGEIWVDSDPGEGSTFHVTFPAVGAAD